MTNNFIKIYLYIVIGFSVLLLEPKLSANDPHHQALYFSVNVNNYEIRMQNDMSSDISHIRLYVPVDHIELMYDRPSTKVKQVALSDLLQYLKQPQNRNLTLTLMVTNPESQTTQPLDFKVIQIHFSPDQHILEFVAALQKPDAFFNIWKKFAQNGVVTGSDTVLFLDG